MKKFLSVFAIAAGVVAIASCAKELMELSEAPVQETVIPAGRFEKVFKTTLTKTNIDGTTPTWAENDTVRIFWVENRDEVAVVCDTVGVVNPETGEISAVVGEARDYYYAVYPSWAQSDLIVTPSMPDSLKVSVKSTSTDGSWGRAHYAAALTDASTALFNFKNISNALKFTVTTPGITSVKITTPDHVATAGRFVFSFNGEDPCDDPRYVENKYTNTVTVNGPGTYYAAVPYMAEWLSGFVISEFAGDELAGFAVAQNPISWGRNYIIDIKEIEEHKYQPHDLYFKTEAAGDGTGTDWDNAAGVETLVEYLSSSLGAYYMQGQNVYLAEGEYDLSNNGSNLILSFPSAFTSNFYGGYPASATGTDLTGRDIENCKTVFTTSTSEGSNIRIFAFDGGAIGQWVLDGICFGPAQDIAKVRGYAMYINGDPDFAETSRVTFSKCDFSGLSGNYYGCVDVNNAAARVTFANCNFEDNEAKFVDSRIGGCALTIENAADIVVTDCTFKNNVSSQTGAGGAAMYVSKVSKLTVSGCTFTGNQATVNSFGGAIVFNEGTAEIINSSFVGNSSATYGGAIGISGKKGLSPDVTISNCSFTENVAPLGGAINHFCGTMLCEECTFTSNEATYTSANFGGGAIATAYKNSDGSLADPAATDSKGFTYLRNCTFTENSSYGRGGCIHEYTQGGFTIEGCDFIGNKTTYKKANGGGAIYHGGPTNTTDKLAADLKIFNSYFEANKTSYNHGNGSGPAISTKNGQNIYIYNTAFYDNRTPEGSTDAEGVISLKDGCAGLSMFRCTFLNNNTGNCVIRAYTVPANFFNCTFAETAVDHSRGIILNTGSNTVTAVNNLVIASGADKNSFGTSGSIKTGNNIYSSSTGVTLSPVAGTVADVAGKTAVDVFTSDTPEFDSNHQIPTIDFSSIMAPASSETIKTAIRDANVGFYEWLLAIEAFDAMPSNWQCGAYQN